MTEGSSNLARVLANVVDIQQSIMLQFDNVTKALDNLKLDQNTAISGLREDLRRTDDRSQKQIDELNTSHQKEVDRLLSIIQTLVAKETHAAGHIPQVPPVALLAQHQNAALQQALLFQQQQAHQQQQQLQRDEMQRMAAQMATQNMSIISGFQQKPVAPPPPFAQQKPVTPVVVPQKETTPIVVPPPVMKPLTPATSSSTSTTVVVPPAVVKPPVVVPPVAAPVVPSQPATATPPAQPIFSFGSKGSIFGKKPEEAVTPKPVAPFSTITTPKSAVKDEEEDVDDYEPEGEFKPVIPLPDLVEVKTGEEGEEVLFNNRSKLYIFANETKEWKERGTGELKILKNKETKKSRVVMRRDQVLKVCANFSIVSGMNVQIMAKNEKAYTWFCEDFSEDEPEHVKFSARFASVEIAKQFKELFEKCAEEHKSLGPSPVKKEGAPVVLPELEKEKPTTSKAGAAVEIPLNKEKEKENVGFGDKFKPAAGSWECPGCYVRNNATDESCSCCGAGKDGKEVDKSASIFSKPSILKPATGTPKFSFGMSAAAVAKEPLGSTAPAPLFGVGTSASPASNSSFGASVTPKPSIFGGGAQTVAGSSTPQFSFGKSSTVVPPAASSTTPSFSFLKASESAGSGSSSPAVVKPSIFGNSLAEKTDKTDGAPESSTPVPFSFKPAADPPKFNFGGKKETTPVAKPAEQPKVETTPGSIFGSFGGSSSGGDLSFASLAAKAKDSSIFEGENARKAQEEFKNQKKSSALVTDDTTYDEYDNNEEDYEPPVDFQPLIPLPDLVEVKTGEEDEEVLFKARCKLFKFFADTKENKERGVGDVKILHHKEANTYRVLMRREQVHKLCANFRVAKSIQMTMKPHMPNVYTFVCQDFSDDVTNGEGSVFTIKFKDEKTASEFKTKFEEIRDGLLP